jgi:predicted AAA+ superfamily ATPase
MIPRYIEKKVQKRLQHMPAVALTGPRQVGKTTLAFKLSQGRPSVYLDLENTLDLQKVSDIEAFHAANRGKLIILDEVQRAPEIFASIRGIIDKERRSGNRAGHFLFLGSASIDLLKQSSETLAGRIAYIELHTVNIMEYLAIAKEDRPQNTLWVRGGFPESLLSGDDQVSLEWRYDFIKTYLERDIPQLGPRVPATTLERFWKMLAHIQGTSINASKIGSNLEVSNTTVARYLDLLVDLLLIRKVQPYSTNIKKRLVKSPRIYVRDSGITHALLNILDYNDLLGHPVVGKSWEGFVVESIASYVPQGAGIYYYRTAGGAEIDLLIEFSPTERWAIEIKLGTSLALSRGFYEACEDIKPIRKFVVYSGSDDFQLKHDVMAVSLHSLLEKLRKL